MLQSLAVTRGASEPGGHTPVLESLATVTMHVDRIEDSDELLRVGFYNVGIQQSMLENKKRNRSEKRLDTLAADIAESFHR